MDNEHNGISNDAQRTLTNWSTQTLTLFDYDVQSDTVETPAVWLTSAYVFLYTANQNVCFIIPPITETYFFGKLLNDNVSQLDQNSL